MLKSIFYALFFTLLTLSAQAQISTPAPSPLGSITQKVGLADVKIEYSRPSAKSRPIFGTTSKHVVPFDQVWRTGANGATTINFSKEMSVNGTKVPAGTFAIYTIPGAAEWTIVLNKNITLGGNTEGYKAEEDVARFKVAPTKLNDKIETFTIHLASLTENTATVEMLWENTKVGFVVAHDAETEIMAQVAKFEKNPMSSLVSNYWNASQYYYNNNKDMQKALEWVNKAIEYRGGEPPYWYLRHKSLVQAKLKDYKGAIETAKTSMEKAKAEGDTAYENANKNSIEEWSKMK
ncbi:MAG: DUF2911 domain-containing protein [Cytophagales bacterium]|nr:MAG: DUF2911 domain-containing protein [Cytophagales bacterium]TAF59608.1 MAG: DUF2911 domain-containing protein [Cytophagales bacterium]